MSSSKLSPVSEVDKISFPGEEELVLKLWKELKVFENCLKQSKDKPRFSFYDGPPFATGLPHYGHILAGTIKDVVTRWAHQTGFHVPRRFGWDTHGLPVEYEIDKTHGIKGPDDVAKMGIKKYNELCRSIVTRYADEWEQIVTRFGRWIDFRNDYKTMYPWFMESVWWVFSQLYNKGLVYRGFKVMPFSTACATPLSNFEAGQNYKDVQDPSVVVTFPVMSSNKVVSNDGTMLVAWTTTPWTLPSNLALCVNPEMDYVKVQGKSREVEGTFVLMEARLTQLFKSPDDYKVLSKFKGKELEGLEYKSLFTYFSEMKSKGAFKVLCDGYVTSESGTGIVHQAPYFGEDDFRVCLSYGIISKDQEAICPVDLAGRFTDTVTHFKGQHVKDADQNIIKHLREEKRLVSADRLNHSYPFCWRSDTPLIYKAVPSWFVRVQHMQEKLLESNADTYWVPDFIKNKRFANWLRDARDWAISRNRYWGTPIPLWVSEDMQEVVCISSIAELERLSGEKVTDIHRDSIDHITIPSSRPGQPPLKRVSEVFDCWFESGSMPYAQVHYPFENKNQFEDCFPADFIAEGVDQTRGWFYTLLVISTSLFGKAPFKNLIVNGLVLASDGQKMSKSKKNYPDPMTIVDKYGADAVRLYLVNSPAVRGENLRFKEDEVFALLKEVFIPWLNAYRYFVQQVERLEKDEGIVFQYDEAVANKPTNVMDKWILSFTQSLLSYVIEEMKAYRLYTVTPKLVKFVDNLTNWYVRFNRKRLKGDAGVKECQQSLNTLYDVLMTMVRIMSPFTPFITETMFQNLKKVLKDGSPIQSDSVHYLMVPTPRKDLISERTESAVSVLQSVVDLGRCLRDKINCPIKYPLPEVVVIQKDKQVLDDVMLLESYIKEELNVRKVTTSTDKDKYGVALKAEINFKLVGARLKGDVKKVQQLVAQLSDEEITKALAAGSIELLGHKITSDEFFIKYSFSGKMADQLASKYQAHSDSSVLILLDTTPSQEMLWEGLAREVINRVQRLKKKAKLVPTDEVTVWYSVSDPTGELPKVIEQHLSHIQTTTRAPLLPLDKRPSGSVVIIEDNDSKINSAPFKFVITKDYASGSCMDSSSTESTASQSNETLFAPPVKLVLNGSPRNGYKNAKSATLLLQNPVGKPTMTKVDEMYLEIERLFGIPKERLQLSLDGKQVKDVKSLNKKTVLIQESGCTSKSSSVAASTPRFVNITSSDGLKGSVLLENPIGSSVMTPAQLEKVSQAVMKSKGSLYLDAEKKKALKASTSDDVAKLHGQTLYC